MKSVIIMVVLFFSVSMSVQNPLQIYNSSPLDLNVRYDAPLLDRFYENHNDTTYTYSMPIETYTSLPPGPVRNIAEFEPNEGTLIRYPLGIPVSMVKELAIEDKVYCMVSSSSQSEAQNAFQNGGVTMSNVTFIPVNTDSYWTRDFGPWWIVDGNGKFDIIDFKYNRPRPNDDAAIAPLAKQLDNSLYNMGLTTAGGNYMCDGYGIGTSTKLVTTESSKTKEQIAEIKKQYLGIHTFLAPDDPLLGSDIDHIDCWAKFLSPDKILIKQVPQGNGDYASLEKATDFWKQQKSSYGTPYKIFRVTGTGESEAYTNSYICNKKVYVPIAGSGNANDAKALEVYKQAMPGYKIIGFTGSWMSTDAIHCRTHEMPDRNMLYISHIPKSGLCEDKGNGIVIEATIIPYSKKDLKMENCAVHYRRKSDANYSKIALTKSGDTKYSAVIPSQKSSDSIVYFVHAEDQSGKSENHPYMGELDPHAFYCNVINTGVIALNTQDIVKDVFVFTNRVQRTIRIEWKQKITSNNASLTLHTVNGKMLGIWNLATGQNSIILNGNTYNRISHGIYIYSLKIDNKVYTKQFQIY